MASDPLLVAVVSPQAVVLSGLLELLRRHPRRVTVVPYPGSHRPDVVLYDVLDLVDGDLTELEALLDGAAAKVLAVSRDLRPDLASRAVAAGALGSISLGVSEEQLLDAVENAASGVPTPLIHPDADDADGRLGGDVGLTVREVQVITLIAQGRTNQEIAKELYLSPNSIKTYVRTAYRKIGASSRSQAVSWAIRHGFPMHGG